MIIDEAVYQVSTMIPESWVAAFLQVQGFLDDGHDVEDLGKDAGIATLVILDGC